MEGLPRLVPPWTLRSGGGPEERGCASSAGKVVEPREQAGWGGLTPGGSVAIMFSRQEMGSSSGAGHFPQLKKRRAGEQKAAAADPVESPGPPGFPDHSPGPRALPQKDVWTYSSHRPCTLTTKWGHWGLTSTSRCFPHRGHPWKSRAVGDTLPGPSPKPASAVHRCSNAPGGPCHLQEEIH